MRDDDDGLVEGRPRRRAPLLAVVAMVAIVAALPLVARGLRGDPVPAEPSPIASVPDDDAPIEAVGLHGRLVYSTFETGGSAQRLVVLDLATGVAAEGPRVPVVEELAAAGPDGPIVIVADDAGAGGIAYVVPDLSRDAVAVELVRGDVLALSADGAALLVGRNAPARPAQACARNAYRATRVSPSLGQERPLLGTATGCGTLVSGVLDGASAVLTVVEDGRASVRPTRGPADGALEGLAVLSRSTRGTYVLADLEGDVPRGLGVWPRTPTGPLLVWPGAGAPRPLVRDVRLFGQRVIAWSRDGSHVVVSGIVGDERGMWLVYVPGGTMVPLLPPNSFPLRSAFSGAAFDDAGTAFAGGPGVIVAATEEGVFPIPLPPGAPTPIGPVAWLA